MRTGRLRSMIIGGAAAVSASRVGDLALTTMRAGDVASIPLLWDAKSSPAHTARSVANDVEALMASRIDRLGFADLLPRLTMPCLVYVGTADPVRAFTEATAAEMPNAAMFRIPDVNHGEAFFRSDLVPPRALEFLNRIASTA